MAAIRQRELTLGLLLGLLAASTATAQTGTSQYDPRAAFAETDTNRDGVVDHDEFIMRVTEVFYRADVDRNGTLSPAEDSAAMVQTDELIVADTDKNGALSLHEFRRARLRDYDTADADASGTLSVTEVVDAYVPKEK
jgi:hypothetical protein